MNPHLIEQIARAAHAVIRELVASEDAGNGYDSLPPWIEPWERAEEWHKAAARGAVVSVMAGNREMSEDTRRFLFSDAMTIETTRDAQRRLRTFVALVRSLASDANRTGYMTTAGEAIERRSADAPVMPERLLGYPVVVDPTLTTAPITLGNYGVPGGSAPGCMGPPPASLEGGEPAEDGNGRGGER